MKNFKVVMFFILFESISSGALSDEIESSIQVTSAIERCNFDQGEVESIRQALIDRNMDKLESIIEFPLPAVLVGREKAVRSFISFSKYYLDDELLNKIRPMEYCELAKALDINPETGKIRNLVINYDPKDAAYAYSGIASAKKLREFMRSSLLLSKEKNYTQLAKSYRYPFYLNTPSGRLNVNTEKEFVLYGGLIADERFINLLEEKIKKENFEKMPRGLMLTQKGEFWILGVSNGLTFEVNGGF